MRFHRRERVSDLIIEELNKIILKEIEIPEVVITITDVKVTTKLEQASVKISVWPSEKAGEVLKIFKKNQRRLQNFLTRKINIRPMPSIFFEIDKGAEEAAKVEKILLENK